MKQFALFILFVSAALSAIAQDHFFVKPNNNPSPDGKSWATAFADLQTGLQNAQSGDTIWVAAGIFKPTTSSSRAIAFKVPSGVRLFGGFSGTEQTLSQRDWKANRTVLSGDIGTQNDSLDNSFNVVFMENPDSFTVFDGFQVERGQADSVTPVGGSFQRWRSGAGIFMEANNGQAYPKIRNCIFKKNTTESHGGAIFINGAGLGSVAPSIENCVFVENWAGLDGGAVYRRGSSWGDIPHDFYKCIFRNNHAVRDGGAIFFRDAPRTDTFSIKECSFIGNSAKFRGQSLFLVEDRTPVSTIILDNIVCDSVEKAEDISALSPDRHNLAFVFFSTYFEKTDLRVLNSNFTSKYYNDVFYNLNIKRDLTILNSKFLGDKTGLVQLLIIDLERNTTVSNCIFNSAIIIIFNGVQSATIENTKFSDYISVPTSLSYLAKGSGFFGKNVSVRNVSVSNNTFTSPIAFGIGESRRISNLIYETNSDLNYPISTNPEKDTLIFINSIFKDEWLFKSGYLQSKYTEFHNCHFGSLDLASLPPNIVLGAGNTVGGSSMFRDSSAGDFRLLPCSPLTNAGTNLPWLAQIAPIDLDGNPRIADGTVDIGPYESPGLKAVAEANAPPACGPGATSGVVFSLENGCGPYQFNWQNALTSGTDTSNLAPGLYYFTITDQKGRYFLDTLEIKGSSPSAVITGDEALCTGDSSGMLLANISGAVAPFMISWNVGSNAPNLENLPAGLYIVNVDDANGCGASDSLDLIEAPKTGLNFTINKASGPSTADGGIVLDLIFGFPPFDFAWSNGDTTGNLNNLLPGNYSLTVTNGIGCSEVFDFLVDFTVSVGRFDEEARPMVQPNLVRDWIKINWNGADRLDIFDNLGQLVGHSYPGAGNTFDLSQLPPGVYTYLFYDKNRPISGNKLVKAN